MTKHRQQLIRFFTKEKKSILFSPIFSYLFRIENDIRSIFLSHRFNLEQEHSISMVDPSSSLSPFLPLWPYLCLPLSLYPSIVFRMLGIFLHSYLIQLRPTCQLLRGGLIYERRRSPDIL